VSDLGETEVGFCYLWSQALKFYTKILISNAAPSWVIMIIMTLLPGN